MTAFLIVVGCSVVAILLLRVRIRLEFSGDRRLLFAGIGRSGPEFDLAARRGVIKLFGWRLKSFDWEGEKKEPAGKATETERKNRSGKKARRKRSFAITGVLLALRKSSVAVAKYLVAIIKATAVETAEGEIEAGFESPDLTGQVFGYYQMAIGLSPALAGRVSYVPVWTGSAFAAEAKLSLAWPLYKLVWQTVLLICRLPLVRIVKLIRESRKGDKNVKQRS